MNYFIKIIFLNVLSITLFAGTMYAQLNQVFNQVFNSVLIDSLSLSDGLHSEHFRPAADIANNRLIPGLNNMIASSVSFFTLTSNVAAVTFELSPTGVPEMVTESLGPIFAETAETLGKGNLKVGFNYSYLNLSKLRGLATEDIRFTFLHQNIGGPILGDEPSERDTIDLLLNLDVNASTFALFITLGVTNHLDVGVAIPIVNVHLSGRAKATINSVSFSELQRALHRFNDDGLNPDLTAFIPYDESATGLGDIALRLKYSFPWQTQADLAALADISLPTGDENDFLGIGKTNVKLSWLTSKRLGNFTPHLNFSYDHRPAVFDSDEFEFTIGFDEKIVTGVTFAFDFLGEYDLEVDEINRFAPRETETIMDQIKNDEGQVVGRVGRKVDLTSIPNRDNDHTLDASFGFRLAPSDRLYLLSNILVPLNDGGLRSSVVPTFGFSITF